MVCLLVVGIVSMLSLVVTRASKKKKKMAPPAKPEVAKWDAPSVRPSAYRALDGAKVEAAAPAKTESETKSKDDHAWTSSQDADILCESTTYLIDCRLIYSPAALCESHRARVPPYRDCPYVTPISNLHAHSPAIDAHGGPALAPRHGDVDQDGGGRLADGADAQ